MGKNKLPLHGFMGRGEKGLMLFTVRSVTEESAQAEFGRRYGRKGVAFIDYLGAGTRDELRERYNGRREALATAIVGGVYAS